MTVIAYHFTSDTLRDGRPIPATGEELRHDGPVEICASGLHASRHVWDALSFAPGHMLHRVECREIAEEQDDKLVYRSRTRIASIDAGDVLRRFARKSALDVIHLWDAPDVVRQYLKTGDENLRAAAWAAARAAFIEKSKRRLTAMVAAEFRRTTQ